MKHVGISHIEYALPKDYHGLEYLEDNGMISESSEVLSGLGFRNCYVADDDSFYLIMMAAKKCLKNVDSRQISYLIKSRALNSFRAVGSALGLMEYDTPKLQQALGLHGANSMLVSEAGCVSFFQAMALAKSILETQIVDSKILCVGGDTLPAVVNRDILYNLISDAAGAVVLEANCEQNVILAYHEVTKPSFFDAKKSKDELLSMYFPTSVNCILASLSKANLSIDDIDWVLPHNVSSNSWKILASLCGIDYGKVYTKNIARIGHTTQADFAINYNSLLKSKKLKKGDKVLCFSFGFGAHWAAMVIEH